MTFLKKFVGTKSLNTKQCAAGLSPRIIPHYPPKPLMGNPGDGGEFHATAKNLLTCPIGKIPFHKFTYSTIKSTILSASNSNFHLIALCNIHL